MDNFTCYVCLELLPIEFRDEHHLKPQAVGGKDEDIIDLCDSCHHKCHRIAYAVLNPKKQGRVDSLMSVFRTPLSKERAKKVIDLLVVFFREKKDSGVATGSKLMLDFSDDLALYKRLKTTAKDNGISIVNFVRGLIEKELSESNSSGGVKWQRKS